MTDPTHPIRPTRRRVLVVEDEPRMGQMLGQAMVELDHPATVVRTGEEALRRMRDQPHDIIVLDLNLPGMSGLECLEKLRADWPHLQAIVLTGFGDLDAARRAIHLDVVEFLTKPAHLGELETALDRAQRRLHEHDLEQLAGEHGPGTPARPAADPQEPTGEPDGPVSLDELERKAILEALDRHDGNRERAADELGISVRTLYYRLKQYQDRGLL